MLVAAVPPPAPAGAGGPARSEWGRIRAIGRTGLGVGHHHPHPARALQLRPSHRADHQVHPHQVGHVARPGVGRDLGQGAGLHGSTALEDHHPIGQGVGVERIVGDEQPHALEGGEVAAQVAAHVGAGADVEGGQRLVEQEQPGVGGQGPGQRHPLGLAPRQGARDGGRRARPRPRRSSQSRARRRASALGRPRARSPKATFSSTEIVLEQQVALEHEPDRPLLGATNVPLAGSSSTAPSRRCGPRRAASGRPGSAARWSCPPRWGRGGPPARRGPPSGRPPDRGSRDGAPGGLPGRRSAIPAPNRCRSPARAGTQPGARPSHRSRRPTSTAKETAVSTRARTIAPSGSLLSRAR